MGNSNNKQAGQKAQPGDRVGALLSATDGVVEWVGWGVYLGDMLVPGWERLAQQMLPSQRQIIQANLNLSDEELINKIRPLMLIEVGQDHEQKPSQLVDTMLQGKMATMRAEWSKQAAYTDEELIGWVQSSGMLRNPCIELDSLTETSEKRLVWGQQVWWGAEEKMQQKLDRWNQAGWEIRQVLIPEATADDFAPLG